MSNPFLGQIIQGGWNFAPRGWAYCAGQILPIAQNTALFSLLGTTYGGNGQTTFALPDLRGRAMINEGQGPGLSNYVLGQVGGTENATLLVTNMPAHTHTATFANNGSAMNVATAKATLQVAPANGVLGKSVDGATTPNAVPEIYCPAGTATPVALAGLNVAGNVTVAAAGGSQPFSIVQPYLAISVVIALEGIFPSRN
jgi:microcystin-dependent protein